MATGNISPAGKSFTGAAEYDLAQGRYAEQEEAKKPEILEQNFLFGNDYKDIGKQFRDVADYNKNVKSPVMKFSINFDPKEKLSDAQKLEFTKRVMKEMGIREDNHQYMITRHSDKAHDHHHILVNRVGMDGKAIDYSHTIPKLEKSIDKVEKEMGLNNDLAKTRRYVFDESSEKGYKVQLENFPRNKSIAKNQARTKTKSLDMKKDYMRKTISKEMSNSKNLEEFKKNLQEKNINADMRFNKENKLTGISFEYDNLSVKGSAMGKEFKASGISSTLENNKLQEQKISAEKQTKIKPEQDIDPILREEITQDFKAETLKNIDKAIEKIEPYREHNSKTYEGMQGLKVAVSENQIENKSDLEKINKVAKKHISDIEKMEKMQKEKSQKIEPEKQHEKAVNDEYHRFTESKSNRKEKEQNQEQNQEKKRGFRR